jgi:hypothetical protein
MLLALAPPAVVKFPPAYKAEPVPSSKTVSASIPCPFIPDPKGDHVAPFHFAMRLELTPPAVVKFPPAYKAGPVPLSKTVRALTVPFIPDPKADHAEPFHLAMRLALTPPAMVKFPPAYKADPVPSLNAASALTPSPAKAALPTPDPNADQLDPFHLAIFVAMVMPAAVKSPPAYKRGPVPSL